MWKLFYMACIIGKISKKKKPVSQQISSSVYVENRAVFRDNLRRSIGQTITVFVIGGGYNGSGYTGILMNVEKEYISIYISPMALAEIPISKIACFSHNML